MRYSPWFSAWLSRVPPGPKIKLPGPHRGPGIYCGRVRSPRLDPADLPEEQPEGPGEDSGEDEGDQDQSHPVKGGGGHGGGPIG